jgi:hypothetical protein
MFLGNGARRMTAAADMMGEPCGTGGTGGTGGLRSEKVGCGVVQKPLTAEKKYKPLHRKYPFAVANRRPAAALATPNTPIITSV